MKPPPSELVATIRACPGADELEPVWSGLERQASCSFFLSWRWIGPMLAEFGPASYLVEVRWGDELVGLALLGRRVRRWSALRSPSLHLGETDHPGSAALTTEYNGFLSVGGLEAQVRHAGMSAILKAPGWREFLLPGVPPDVVQECRRPGSGVRVLRQYPAPFVQFTEDDPLDALSRNTRHQIRRSLKLYPGLELQRASGAAQALEWFDRMSALHSAYWHGRGHSGAFADPKVIAFHRRLVAAGDVDLHRLGYDGQEVGYLYNFVHDGWAYAYQSGFRYDADPRRKPGLAGHLLAMRRYRAEGLCGYRLLAGDSRYKSSLASARDTLVWAVVDRADPLHRLERWLREVRASLRQGPP